MNETKKSMNFCISCWNVDADLPSKKSKNRKNEQLKQLRNEKKVFDFWLDVFGQKLGLKYDYRWFLHLMLSCWHEYFTHL